MKGKLIVIEGIDGSGKATQTKMLCEHLLKDEVVCARFSVPRYGKPSAKLIEMYLAGEFGNDPNAVSAYEASKFYAIDRYASYKDEWGKLYENGWTIIADRYTPSNAIHQGAKIPRDEQFQFLHWLEDFEYVKMGLPKPDLVLYLDMPLEVSEKLMRSREDKTNTKADIHERNTEYLAQCNLAARAVALYSGWCLIPCANQGEPRTVEDIHEDIYRIVKKLL